MVVRRARRVDPRDGSGRARFGDVPVEEGTRPDLEALTTERADARGNIDPTDALDREGDRNRHKRNIQRDCNLLSCHEFGFAQASSLSYPGDFGDAHHPPLAFPGNRRGNELAVTLSGTYGGCGTKALDCHGYRSRTVSIRSRPMLKTNGPVASISA